MSALRRVRRRRSGILVLVNDVDWEVLEGGDTELAVVLFLSCDRRTETTSSSYLHCTEARAIHPVSSTNMPFMHSFHF